MNDTTTAQATTGKGSMRRALFAWLLLSVAVTFALRWDYLSMPFWGDDFDFQLAFNRMQLHETGALFSPYWGWMFRPVSLFYLWFMQEGLQGVGPAVGQYFVSSASDIGPMSFRASANVMHGANLLIHSGSVFLLGVLIYRLSRDKWLAIVAPLIFILYPAKEHAVQWVSCVSVLFACFFSLLCLNCWLSFLRHPSRLLYVGALLSFVLALGSKEEALMAAPMIAVLTIYERRRATLLQVAPFALLLIGYLYLSWTAANYAKAHPRFDWQSSVDRGGQNTLFVWLQFYARALLMPIDLLLAGTKALQSNSTGCGQAACTVFDFLMVLPRVALGIACAVIITAVGFMCRSSRVALFAFIWGAASTLLMAALVNDYVLGSEWFRFYYAPALPVSLLWAIGARSLVTRLTFFQSPHRDRGQSTKIPTAVAVE